MAQYNQIVTFRSDDEVVAINTGLYAGAIDYPFEYTQCYEDHCFVISIPDLFSTGRAAYVRWGADGSFEAIPLRRKDILQENKEVL